MVNLRQIIKYGRCKHAYMGLILMTDQWAKDLSRHMARQGLGEIQGVLVP